VEVINAICAIGCFSVATSSQQERYTIENEQKAKITEKQKIY